MFGLMSTCTFVSLGVALPAHAMQFGLNKAFTQLGRSAASVRVSSALRSDRVMASISLVGSRETGAVTLTPRLGSLGSTSLFRRERNLRAGC